MNKRNGQEKQRRVKAKKRFNLLSLDGVVRMCVSKRLMTKKVDPGGSPP